MGVDSLLRAAGTSLITAVLVVPLLSGCAPGASSAAPEKRSPTASAEPADPTAQLIDYAAGARLDPAE